MPSSITNTQTEIQIRASGRGLSFLKNALQKFVAYLHDLPATYPNYLIAPEPQRRHYACSFFVLSALMLFCLIPRAMISLQISSVCPDGVLYIRLAKALHEGHYQEAFEGMKLNIYPMILLVLYRLGLSWETGGMLWGLLMSSLVVLPLYGFARRQFDDTVALVSCLLYAVHPIFIQWSPEIMRDPTFWFLFTLSLYLQWRAVTEVRIVLAFAAGLSTTLAMLTRFEGLFLLIPLCLWTFWRYKALISGRDKTKLALGWAATVIVFPTLLLLINITLLRNHSQWIFIRFHPLLSFFYRWNNLLASPPVATSGQLVQQQAGITFSRMIAIYVPTLVKSLSPLFALLMLGGLWGWPRVWARRDHQPLFYTALVVLGAAWIYTWCGQESSERYFLPIVLMAAMFAALGLLALSKKILWLTEWLNVKAILQHAAVFTPALIVACGSWAVAFSGPFERRAAEVELAAWVREEFGPAAVLLGSEGITPVLAYYAQVNAIQLIKELSETSILEKVQDHKPDVILLLATSRNNLSNPWNLINRIKEMGYTEIDRAHLPRGTDTSLIVLRRGQVKLPVSLETGKRFIVQK